MFGLNNRSQEQDARAYCVSIGADPDEVVSGCMPHRSPRQWVRMSRWRFYLGVSEAALSRPI